MLPGGQERVTRSLIRDCEPLNCLPEVPHTLTAASRLVRFQSRRAPVSVRMVLRGELADRVVHLVRDLGRQSVCCIGPQVISPGGDHRSYPLDTLPRVVNRVARQKNLDRTMHRTQQAITGEMHRWRAPGRPEGFESGHKQPDKPIDRTPRCGVTCNPRRTACSTCRSRARQQERKISPERRRGSRHRTGRINQRHRRQPTGHPRCGMDCEPTTIGMPNQMHIAQPQPFQNRVNATRRVCGGEDRSRLNACSGLAQHIHRINGEIVCQARDLVPPHGRGQKEPVYQHDGHTAVRPVLIYPNGAETRGNVMHDFRPRTQCP